MDLRMRAGGWRSRALIFVVLIFLLYICIRIFSTSNSKRLGDPALVELLRRFGRLPASEGDTIDLGLFVARTVPRTILLTEERRYQYKWQHINPNEMAIHAVFDMVLDKTSCGGGGLILDVGANEGMYSFIGAAYGCRVLTFEPQPSCLPALQLGIAVNEFEDKIDLRNNVVSPYATTFEFSSDSPCSGVAQFPLNGTAPTNTTVSVTSVRLDDLVHQDVLIMHMDVEGAEMTALMSATALLEKYRIENFIFEVAPHRWPTIGYTLSEGIEWFERARALQNWTCRDLRDMVLIGGYRGVGPTTPMWSLPPTDVAQLMRSLKDKEDTDVWCSRS